MLAILHALGMTLGICECGPIEILRPLAEKGEPLAQMIVGKLYEKGEGAPHDCSEAVKWFMCAAEHGIADAQFELGAFYHQGQCVAKDDWAAEIWFERSGEKGDPRGLTTIGEIYLGHGDIPPGLREGYRLVSSCCQAGRC